MKILGIETSCDETAASVIQDGRVILSNIVASSLKDHERYGGIIPEIASRRQMELIGCVVDEALIKAQCSFNDIDAIAVTRFPGLLGSLLVGIAYAKAIAKAASKPLIEINHIEGHLYANFLHNNGEAKAMPQLPAIGLVVSGGHTSLFHVDEQFVCTLLGQTQDDAVGEAFDKVARILDLGYPGGPVIDKIASQVKETSIRFTKANLGDSHNFSFSGLKTAVLYYVRKHDKDSDFNKAHVAHAFQETAVKSLVETAVKCCRAQGINTLLMGGGVAANSALRSSLTAACQTQGIRVFFPPMALCLDNAAMIAGLGFMRQPVLS